MGIPLTFQSILNDCTLFTNHTSAVKGFFPPKGIPNKLRKIGIFSVLRVCLPGPNFPMICPLENNTAS